MKNKPKQGYRHFECECGEKWSSPTRDCFSPSGEDCDYCFDFVFPHDRKIDETLKVDKSGNLI